MITIRALIELPHLALELVAGGTAIDRPVRWAHVAEVEDPTPWLEGGELILTTGLGLPSAADGQVAYLERLAHAGAVGVVVVRDSAPSLAPDFLAVADDLGFPVIATLLKQPFQAISKVVFTANSSVEVERVVKHLRIYGVLRTAAEQGAGPREILTRLAELTGTRLAVVREDGRPQFEPGEPHRRWQEALAALEALGVGAKHGLYARLDGDGVLAAAYVIQVDAASSRVFLIAEEVSESAVTDLVALHHIATIVAAQVATQRAARAVGQKLGSQLLPEIVERGLADESTRARLRALGLGETTFVVLSVRAAANANALADELYETLLDHDVPALVRADSDRVTVLAPAVELEELVLRVAGAYCALGVGTPGALGHAAVSYREALAARAYAESVRRPVVHFGRLDAPLAWLATDPDRVDLLIERTVAPIAAYDDEHGTELLASMREFLRSDRSLARAAETLHVHRNTLSYRLRKAEAVSGRSLRRMEDQVELWLGLRAFDLARRDSAEGQSAGSTPT